MAFEKTTVVVNSNSGTGPNLDPTDSFISTSNLWIDFPLLESFKCSSERISSLKWTFWTVWDETLLEKIYPWLKMSPGVFYRTSLRKLERRVKDGFRRITRDEFNYADNVIVVKVLKQKEESFCPITETTCLKVLEYSFLEEGVTINSTPMDLIACSGLADILREVHREMDILMIRGSFQKVAASEDSGNEKIYLPTNGSGDCGDMQLIRLTFLDDATTALIEEIKPRPQSNRYVFKYTAVALTPSNGSTRRRTATWHQNFRWQKSKDCDLSGRRWTDCEGTLAEFEGPISAQQDAIFSYRKLMKIVPNRDMHLASVFTRSISSEGRNCTVQGTTRSSQQGRSEESQTWKKLTVFFVILSCFIIFGLMLVISDPRIFMACLEDEADDIFLTNVDKPTEPFMETIIAYIASVILWIKVVYATCFEG